ncbi:MAG TPA: protoglobin domain-containing protein [Methylomirabilota bacterium]|jgi:hypothetical protein|nr:protoglobin domain-containing protein [Methylomirabilota bacterium]
MPAPASIPGYRPDQPSRSPITPPEFELMKKSVLFGDEDVKYLRLSHDVLQDQVDAILDVWYGFVASHPHLLAAFASRGDGHPLGAYLAAVRLRFGQWILDTARAQYDEAWLAYQHEIGLRHHRTKKNRTDAAPAREIVPFRDLFLLIFPITFTLKPFLGRRGHSAEDVERMYHAWLKSCLLQVTLWSYPYVKEGDF